MIGGDEEERRRRMAARFLACKAGLMVVMFEREPVLFGGMG